MTAAETGPASPVKLLIVDDREANLVAFEAILADLGHPIILARSGKDALRYLLKGEEFAVILMDVMMPEMDGITAVREIRKRPEWKRLAVIMLTAKAMKDDQENCLTAGANDYMAKPLDVEKLLSLVRVWMPR